MAPFIDLTGQKIGRLTVIARNAAAPRGHRKQAYWDCLCECGNAVTVISQGLRLTTTRSCGCLKIDSIIQRSTTHGKNRTPEHLIWMSMVQRCRNPNSKSYKNYGGRGIRVCDRWSASFENFLEDMGLRPSPKLSIDRINNDGNYEPGNCRWATASEQAFNRRPRSMTCPQGHPYSGKSKSGRRICHICQAERTRRYRQRKTQVQTCSCAVADLIDGAA